MNKKDPMIETQNHAVQKVMMWVDKCTSLHQSNLHSILKYLTCDNQKHVTHALKDLHPKDDVKYWLKLM